MKTKITVETLRQRLTVIANSKKDSCYINGIRLFLKNWDSKTLVEIKRLCEQIKEVAVSDELFSIDVFGKKGTAFFKSLDIESIDLRDN